MIIKNIVLDINKEYYKPILAKQGDAGSRYLSILLLDDNTPFNLDGKAVKIYGKKQDGKIVFNDCEIIGSFNESFIKVELTSQMLAVPGILDIELMILQDESVLTTIPFKINVIESLNNDNALESTNELSTLIQAIQDTEKIKDSFEEEYQRINITFNELENKWEDQFSNKYNNLETEYAGELTAVKKDFSGIRLEFDAIKDQIAANKPIVINDDAPIGSIIFKNSGDVIPSNWLWCDGTQLNKTDYPELFAAIGYNYGGSGETFKLPYFIRGEKYITMGRDNATSDIIVNDVPGVQGIIKAKNISEDMKTIAQQVETVTGNYDNLNQSLQNTYANKTTEQEWTQFKDNGGEVGGLLEGTSIKMDSIYAKNGDMINIATNTDKLIFQYFGGTNYFRPESDGWLELGHPAHRFKDLHLGGSSKSVNGYTKLPNGMIMQWGSAGFLTGQHSNTITFPISFPTSCNSVTYNLTGSQTVNPVDCMYSVGSITQSYFDIYYNKPREEYQGLVWIAIGY